ncbi:gag-pol polyprotein [Ceraceosorus bombacis]|uniref:Gag-pol polyprotein n=1 Tax=Ceraceosorus bombacis TaxID=401625 RepID=A0A0P1BJC3_9BASI|nr:gag-pol polyprotein [Ceraceosorus bombacis]
MVRNFVAQELDVSAETINRLPSGEFAYGLAANFAVTADPRSYKQAMASPSKSDWHKAMQAELLALETLRTWRQVPTPENTPLIHCQWIYKTKKKADGTVDRYKARVVARGDQQEADSADTYAPVANMSSHRLLCSLAAHHNWPMHPIDVDTAYLNAARTGDPVFMHPPPGYNIKPGHCLEVNMALYGLRTSALDWFQCWTKAMQQLRFRKSVVDPCVFVRVENGSRTYIGIHVDDGIIVGSDLRAVEQVKSDLRKHFKIKDMGNASNVLGIQITRDKSGIYLSQQAYLNTVSERFKSLQGKAAPTPLSHHKVLNNTEPAGPVPYLQLLGSLMYAMIGTRPDPAHALGVLSRHASSPTIGHWNSLINVLEYTRSTAHLRLAYRSTSTPPRISVYCNSDFSADTETSRSTSGHIVLLGGHAVVWSSRRQPRVAHSTTEAEYVEMGSAAQSAIHICELLKDIELPHLASAPAQVHCDNEGAVKTATNGKKSYRNRHIRVDDHFVREVVQTGKVEFIPTRTKDMLADIFTKLGKNTRTNFLSCTEYSRLEVHYPAVVFHKQASVLEHCFINGQDKE